ncbi:MAG TPA: hypothetical protein PK808_07920, partial [Polymorphobacter sp.]|nr:hypothetical protein [Polymorphobacter sp.]
DPLDPGAPAMFAPSASITACAASKPALRWRNGNEMQAQVTVYLLQIRRNISYTRSAVLVNTDMFPSLTMGRSADLPPPDCGVMDLFIDSPPSPQKVA